MFYAYPSDILIYLYANIRKILPWEEFRPFHWYQVDPPVLFSMKAEYHQEKRQSRHPREQWRCAMYPTQTHFPRLGQFYRLIITCHLFADSFFDGTIRRHNGVLNFCLFTVNIHHFRAVPHMPPSSDGLWGCNHLSAVSINYYTCLKILLKSCW